MAELFRYSIKHLSRGDLITSFLGSVAATSAAVNTYILIGILYRGGETSLPLATRILHSSLFFAFLFPLSGFFVALWSALPMAILIWLARCFGLKNVVYYLLGGIAVGVLLNPIFIGLAPSFYTDPPETPSFIARCLTWLPVFVASGAFGGFAFWLLIGRCLRRIAV
jgi:hypothetical protein